MKLDKNIEGHLSTMLEGYEQNLKGLQEFVNNAAQQLEASTRQRDETLEKIGELKELLGLEEEVEQDSMEASE